MGHRLRLGVFTSKRSADARANEMEAGRVVNGHVKAYLSVAGLGEGNKQRHINHQQGPSDDGGYMRLAIRPTRHAGDGRIMELCESVQMYDSLRLQKQRSTRLFH